MGENMKFVCKFTFSLEVKDDIKMSIIRSLYDHSPDAFVDKLFSIRIAWLHYFQCTCKVYLSQK
jgi:hypothetical protein